MLLARIPQPLAVALIALAAVAMTSCHLIFRYEDEPAKPPGDASLKKDLKKKDRGRDGNTPPKDVPSPPPLDGKPPRDLAAPPPPDMPSIKPDGASNGGWYVMLSGTNMDLAGVYAISSTNVYAVGEKGTVLHYDGNKGNTWKVVPSGKSDDLNAVHGLGSGVLVVGDGNTNLECSTSSCAKSRFASTIYYKKNWHGTWCDGQADCYVGGRYSSSGKAYWYRMSGTFWWQLCSSPGSFLGDDVTSLYGLKVGQTTTIYATGQGGRVASIALLTTGCTALAATNTTATMRGLWGLSTTPLYAVGDAVDNGSGKRAALMAWNGKMWTHQTHNISTDLNGIWGASGNQVWAVGDGGVILKYNGSTWRSVQLPLTKDLNWVHGTGPKDLYAVGDGGTILRFR